MFGVIGALIVSRDPRNAIGLLLLWGCFTTATLVHGRRARARGWSNVADPAPTTQVLGLVSGLRVVVRDPPGPLPAAPAVPRRSPAVAPVEAVPLVDRRRCCACCSSRSPSGRPTVTTSSDTIELDNPLYVEALGRVTIPDAVFAVLYFGTVGRLSSRRSSSGSAEPAGSNASRSSGSRSGVLAAFVASSSRTSCADEALSAIVGGVGIPRVPDLDRGRGPAVPPVRPRRRREADGRLRGARRSSRPSSTSRSSWGWARGSVEGIRCSR